MAKFIYKAKKGLEEIVEGMIEAENQDDAFSEIKRNGLFPMKIEPYTSDATSASLKSQKLSLRKAKIKSKDILIFTQKLSTLIRSKIELLSALKILHEQTEHMHLRDVIIELYEVIKDGKTFSESLQKFPFYFTSLYVNIVKAGETSGRLDSALEQISEFLSREERLKSKVVTTLSYPILLLFVGLASILVLINFVIPKLGAMFEDLSIQLPLMTRIILDLSDISQKSLFWVFIGVVFAIFVLVRLKGRSIFNRFLKRLQKKLPLVGRLIRNQEFAHFTRTLHLLLNSGVSALHSLEIATPNVEDLKLRKQLKEVYERVASGETLAKSMQTYTNLPSFLVKMIAIGEESGRLDEVLDELSHSYTQQVEADIAVISSLLEPLLILALGTILGTIVLSVLLPIFQITQVVH